MEKRKIHEIIWLEDLKGRDKLQYLGVDWKIILVWIVGKYGAKVWSGFIWPE
jgi:hypothetical protein